MPTTKQSVDDAKDSNEGGSPGSAAKVLRPAAELATIWGVRKLMEWAYRRRTGAEPPKPENRDESLYRVVVWAAATAAALALVKVAVDRASARYLD
jgi:hypothetical protein